MYFIVKTPLKIGKRYYRPCICYALSENLSSTVADLAKQEKAEIFNAPVYFQSGKMLAKEQVKEQPKVVIKRKEKKVKAEPLPEVSEPESIEEDSVEGF